MVPGAKIALDELYGEKLALRDEVRVVLPKAGSP